MTVTEKEVLAALSSQPRRIGDLGLEVLRARRVDASGMGDQPVGAFLAQQGISLSGLQKLVDGLVSDGRARELRGRELWDSFQDGLGANAKGRHFVSAS